MIEGIVIERQLCEHLAPAQLDKLHTDSKNMPDWDYVIIPQTISGRPIRLDKVQGGYKLVYGDTIEELKGGNRSGDEPGTAAIT